MSDTDIYSYGFDTSLNKIGTDTTSPTGFNAPDATTDTQALDFNNLSVGANNSNLALDPSKGIWLGNQNFASAPFSVDMLGNLKASAANITGTITASTGSIGGFSIGADYVRDAANSMGLASTVTGADDVRFWSGDTFANRAIAPFNVTEGGTMTVTRAVITGNSAINPNTLSGLVNLSNENVAAQGWTQTSAFSVASATQVNWAAGTFTTAAGTSYSIGSGNTGAMAAKNYVYLDIGVSTTAYQITTTATTAIGSGKVLIAICQNNTSEAVFLVMNEKMQNTDGSNIVTGSVTTNEIAASTIVAGNIAANTITGANILTMNIAGKNATFDTGTIGGWSLNTSGIIGPSNGFIRAGQTDYNTGVGFWLGKVGTTPKFSIGDPSGYYLNWDGSNLIIKGTLPDTQTFNANGTWTQPSGARIIRIVCVGGGGGGGNGNNGTGAGGSGGGGGARIDRMFLASDITSTVAITVGAQVSAQTQGNSSSFGSYVSSFGGGAGSNNTTGNIAGATGGGVAGPGSVTGAGPILGGSPANTSGVGGIGGAGAGSVNNSDGLGAEYGGASAGATANGGTKKGGSSFYGGGGGGCGSTAVGAGGDGGKSGSTSAGGGGTAGTAGNPGSDGGAGTSVISGSGGGGGGHDGNGGNGGSPGGGGGGGGGTANTTGGNGASGQVIVYSF